ncbi:MAG: hypothetical protein D6760_00895 [Deltaproteobacteria bacterium]|nr:MAG: hypothetical protein D6760_00895 [Deltaproteobacteria bacterium]
MPLRRFAELLEEARELLVEARSLLAGSTPGPSGIGSENSVLALYEALRGSLQAIDSAKVDELLGRVRRVLDDLGALERELERLKRLRGTGGKS